MVPIECPACKRTHLLPESVLGTKVECTDCRHVFVATHDSGRAEVPDGQRAATPSLQGAPTLVQAPGHPAQPAGSTRPSGRGKLSTGAEVLLIAASAALLLAAGAAIALLTVRTPGETEAPGVPRPAARGPSAAYAAAESAMGAGMVHMNSPNGKGAFQNAAKALADVRQRFPASKEAIQASVLEPICQAYVNVADSDWEAAILKETKAGEEIERVRATHPELDEWSRTAKALVANLHSYRLQANTYRELLAEAMKEGDVTAAAKDPFNAERSYNKVLELLKHEGASILPAQEAKDLSSSVAEKIKALWNHTPAELERAVEKARADGDLKLVLIALRNQYKVKPDPKIKEEINEVQAKMALAKARQYIATGQNLDLAIRWLKKVSEFQPTGPIADQAKAELARLESMDPWSRMVMGGDAHFAARRWAEAQAEYERAAQAKLDPTLQNKMVECRFQLALARADQLRRQNKDDEATKAFQEALAIKSSAKDLIESRLAAMGADRRCCKLMADGYTAMTRDQWAAARQFFVEAQKIRDTAQVKAAIAETRYQENMGKGRDAFDADQWDSAAAYFKLAKSFKDCPEIQEWIREAEQKQKSGD